ncbi:MAG: isochorismatase family protein [Caldiserica bacterium]|nr:isochorismatase family protein [Caldisericota bacterium]
MPKPTNKQELLDETQREYEALERQVASFTRDEMVRPAVIGAWSIKDILAHLLEWQRMFMGWYEAGLRGEKPALPVRGYNWSELPALNQEIYERYKDAALDDIRSQLETSHRQMLDVAASLSEEELFTPGRHKWTGSNTLASYINSYTGARYRWAQTGIRRGADNTGGKTPEAEPVTTENLRMTAQPSRAAGKSALLVVDVQRELFEKSTPIYQADQLLRNINLLVDRAHAADAPVFFVQHASWKTLVEGTDGWKLHPALMPLKSDNFVRKHHSNAFQDTPLKAELDALHVRRVVVTGLLSQNCVQATCNGAHDLGYDVVLVKDAHSNYNARARDVINEWNDRLSRDGVVRLESTVEVDFGVTSTK